ncbi:MAG: hypothetical protein RIS47_1227 [Bacteroidota bacterium]|jgi:hypothetical protein
MKFILTHSGKQHSYYLAKALADLDALERFYTSSYVGSEWLQEYLLRRGDTFWTRRFIAGLGGNLVQSNWRFELPELVLRIFLGKSPLVQRSVYWRDVQFDSFVARKLTKLGMSRGCGFWGFQGSCRDSLVAANALGMPTVCELATAHVTEARRELGLEAKLMPDWADSIDNLEFTGDYLKRLEEEPHLARWVVAASEYTRKSLLADGVAEDKILQLPLGFDLDYVPYVERSRPRGRPLRLLYVGTVTQRKGIAYLLEAMKSFSANDVELHIIGGVQGSGDAFRRSEVHYVYHAPVSQRELFAMYADFDALVLPTIFEGFGLVIVEAMAAGLPCITTAHSIGPDLIRTGDNGYIVPIRDVTAIVDAVSILLDTDDDAYLGLCRRAREAALGFTWGAHRDNLSRLLDRIEN